MEVKEYIETIADWQNWKKFLMGHSKEELAELIINRMSRDSSYCRETYHKLVKRSLSVKEAIDDYETEVNYEINKRIPDVSFLTVFSEIEKPE